MIDKVSRIVDRALNCPRLLAQLLQSAGATVRSDRLEAGGELI
jgi:hypothetical protein